jgi:hypothetical protein
VEIDNAGMFDPKPMPEPTYDTEPAHLAEIRRQQQASLGRLCGFFCAVFCIVWPFVAATLMEYCTFLHPHGVQFGFYLTACLLWCGSFIAALRQLT